jgi:hypothetical protein
MTRPLCKALAIALFALALAGGAARAQGVKPAPSGKYAREYELMRSASWASNFPKLGRFEVLAPSTGKAGEKGAYNCIAHSIKVYSRWVWPGTKVADFDKLYSSYGYRRVKGLDYSFDRRYEKVVLYAKVTKGKWECTHGSRQLADGTWTSKLGAGPLIRHNRPESVAGPSYGKPIAVYVKPRKLKTAAATTVLAAR